MKIVICDFWLYIIFYSKLYNKQKVMLKILSCEGHASSHIGQLDWFINITWLETGEDIR